MIIKHIITTCFWNRGGQGVRGFRGVNGVQKYRHCRLRFVIQPQATSSILLATQNKKNRNWKGKYIEYT